MRALIIILVFFLTTFTIASDQIPAPPQKNPILLVNADIYPVSSRKINEGALLFDKGIIKAIGRRITNLPDNTQTIDLEGKRIYPGIIAAASIIAKVYHDQYVEKLLDDDPDLEKYGWRTNMC